MVVRVHRPAYVHRKQKDDFAMKYPGIIAGLTASLLSALSSTASETLPNVVLIISDDQAWTDYGFMAHPVIETPHLDCLARRSALFRRGYVPTALCRPSLATLATGFYAHQHGITGNDPAGRTYLEPNEFSRLRAALISKIDRVATLPELLGGAGYLSHQSGKWWEGSYRRGRFTHGMTRGFPEPGGRHGDDGLRIGRNGMSPVLNFIDSAVEEDRPFFVWYAPFLPHTPHTPPARLLEKYLAPGRSIEIVRYYAMCEWFDETCGELIRHIDRRGITTDTMVVYVTDNGWIQRTSETEVPNGWPTPFAPRSKLSAYEGGVRTPIMLCWPGRIPPGERNEIISSIDLFPTILTAAGVEVPAEIPGINLLPVVEEENPLDRTAVLGEALAHDIADLDNPQTSLLHRWVIRGRWKLILTYDGKVGSYKVVHSTTEHRPQLFDLLEDPHERNNLAGQYAEVTTELAELIGNWWTVDQRQVLTMPDPIP